jgi:hypothetical protein
VCDHGASGGRQQLHPPARHVVCGADMVRIGLERNPVGDCELVVFHSGGLSYKAGLGAERTFTFSWEKPLLNV